jgi:hypothetical protein
MNGTTKRIKPGTARHSWGHVGLHDISKPVFTERFGRRERIFPKGAGNIPRVSSQDYRDHGQNGASIHAAKRWSKMIKNFKNLFRKKTEDSMQERAEESRKTKDIKDQFDETQHNLEKLLNEITKKKNHG